MKRRRRTILKKGINKRCTKCKQVKLLEEFGKASCLKDGHTYYCKLCTSEYQKQYQRTHKVQIAKQRKQHYIDNKPRLSEYRRQYNLNNKQVISANNKQYYKDNKTDIDCRRRKERMSLCTSDFTEKLPITDNSRFHDNKLTVICKYCETRFQPTKNAVLCRIQAFNGTHPGEHNFYCSDKCKQECPIFNHNSNYIDPRSSQYIPKTEQEEARNCQTNHLKQLQCDEVGHNYCEKCNDIIDVELHHTQEIAKVGKGAVNSAGHMLLCPGCHVELHGEC